MKFASVWVVLALQGTNVCRPFSRIAYLLTLRKKLSIIFCDFFDIDSKKMVHRIMLRLKVCMIVSMLQGSIWINTYLNLRMKSLRDLDSIIFRLLKLWKSCFCLAKHSNGQWIFPIARESCWSSLWTNSGTKLRRAREDWLEHFCIGMHHHLRPVSLLGGSAWGNRKGLLTHHTWQT